MTNLSKESAFDEQIARVRRLAGEQFSGCLVIFDEMQYHVFDFVSRLHRVCACRTHIHILKSKKSKTLTMTNFVRIYEDCADALSERNPSAHS